MSEIDRCLRELDRTLVVRGRPRRRLLAECRDHLTEASLLVGEQEAVRRFGDVSELARDFDTETVVRRGRSTTVATAAGVLGVGGSTLVVLQGADPQASANVAWAVVFFACAQASAACLALAALRGIALRYASPAPSDVALTCRRSVSALAFALVTMFAAAASVTGHAAAWRVLVGPAVALLAGISVLRTRSLARRVDPDPSPRVRAPLVDLATLAHRSADAGRPAWVARPDVVLLPTVLVAMTSAFVWFQLDHGSVSGAATVAGVEGGLVVVGYALLGPALGLRGPLGRLPQPRSS